MAYNYCRNLYVHPYTGTYPFAPPNTAVATSTVTIAESCGKISEKRSFMSDGAVNQFVGKLTHSELEDRFITLNDDHMALKRLCNEQQDRLKRLATKLIRMSKVRRMNDPPSFRKTGFLYERIDDMSAKILELLKENGQLKSKIAYLLHVMLNPDHDCSFSSEVLCACPNEACLSETDEEVYRSTSPTNSPVQIESEDCAICNLSRTTNICVEQYASNCEGYMMPCLRERDKPPPSILKEERIYEEIQDKEIFRAVNDQEFMTSQIEKEIYNTEDSTEINNLELEMDSSESSKELVCDKVTCVRTYGSGSKERFVHFHELKNKPVTKEEYSQLISENTIAFSKQFSPVVKRPYLSVESNYANTKLRLLDNCRNDNDLEVLKRLNKTIREEDDDKRQFNEKEKDKDSGINQDNIDSALQIEPHASEVVQFQDVSDTLLQENENAISSYLDDIEENSFKIEYLIRTLTEKVSHMEKEYILYKNCSENYQNILSTSKNKLEINIEYIKLKRLIKQQDLEIEELSQYFDVTLLLVKQFNGGLAKSRSYIEGLEKDLEFKRDLLQQAIADLEKNARGISKTNKAGIMKDNTESSSIEISKILEHNRLQRIYETQATKVSTLERTIDISKVREKDYITYRKNLLKRIHEVQERCKKFETAKLNNFEEEICVEVQASS